MDRSFWIAIAAVVIVGIWQSAKSRQSASKPIQFSVGSHGAPGEIAERVDARILAGVPGGILMSDKALVAKSDWRSLGAGQKRTYKLTEGADNRTMFELEASVSDHGAVELRFVPTQTAQDTTLGIPTGPKVALGSNVFEKMRKHLVT